MNGGVGAFLTEMERDRDIAEEKSSLVAFFIALECAFVF